MRGRLLEGNIYRIRARARGRNSVLLYPRGAARRGAVRFRAKSRSVGAAVAGSKSFRRRAGLST